MNKPLTSLDLAMPYHGPYGTATPVNLSQATGMQQAALAAWLLELPNQAVAWNHYQIAVVHLAPMAGFPEPVRKYPEAEFELMMLALNPDLKPDANDPMHTFAPLEPTNYVTQFHGVTDADARVICAQMARVFCDGFLPAEPRTTELTPPPRRPHGIVVPGDHWTMNIGARDKIVVWGGRTLSARQMYELVVANTVEHARTGGHAHQRHDQ